MRDGLPLITIWAHREIKGWTGDAAALPHLEPCPVVPVLEGLEAVYDTDAHFWPAWVEDGGEPQLSIPRLKKEVLPTLEAAGAVIRFGLITMDVDDPLTHKAGSPARPEWLEAEIEKLSKLPWVGTMGMYCTRGGYRLLWLLREPLGIDDYFRFRSGFREALKRHGIDADDLKDWGRSYRLPRVVRFPGKPHEDRERDFSALGVLDWAPPSVPTPAADRPFAGIAGAKQATPAYKVPEKITKNRNMELTRVAGVLRRAHLSPDAILVSLRATNEERCDPPLPDEELVHIAGSAGAWDPGAGPGAVMAGRVDEERTTDPEGTEEEPEEGEAPRPRPGQVVARAAVPLLASSAPRFTADSDVHIADHTLGELETDGETLVFDRGRLWRYSQRLGIWEELPGHVVRLVVASFDQELIAMGEKIKPFRAGAQVMNNVLKVVQDARSAPGWLDKETPGLAFKNGFATVTGQGVELMPLGPRWRATCAIPMDYSPGKRPERLLRFLNQCFEGDSDAETKIAALQEFVGASLLGLAPKYQRGLILVGTGANGKSTFQKVVCSLFQGRMITSVPPQEMDQEYRRALLAGSRLNVVNELPEADILSSEAAKAMISGDLMTARQIREAPFEFHPKAGHLYAANALPNVRDLTQGFFRRWIIIGWGRTFAPAAQDPGLADRIIKEELDAVAGWALDGAVRLERAGSYTIPESSGELIEEWRQSADQVAAWLETRCIWPPVDGTDPSSSATELYNDYARWAGGNGHQRMTSHKFGRRLGSLGVDRVRKHAGYVYRVALRKVELVGGLVR